MEAARVQRQWQLEDRDEERSYNRQQLDETRAYSRTVLSSLVEDAEKAGFNPMTVLRNGGGSNYNAGAGLAPLSATPLTRNAPVRQAPETVVASGDIGAGVSRVGDFLANFDPFADDKREQESRLIESQIASLNAGGLSGVKRGRGNFATGNFDRSAPVKSASLSGASRSTAGKTRGYFDRAPSSDDDVPLWVVSRDRDGKLQYIPNPDGPDIDQWLTPFLARAGYGAEAAIRTVRDLANGDEKIRVKQVPKTGTWRDWVPSFSLKWK